MTLTRYRSFPIEIKRIFGGKIFKVTLDGGLTCPNIDGRRARNGCTFCQDASYSGLTLKEGLSITEQIQKGITYVQSRHQTGEFFAYFQNGTNTYAPLPVLQQMYEEALQFKEIVGLMIATRPDCIGEDILNYLSELNQKTYLWIELGLQSHRNDVLEKINRAHTVEEYEETVMRLKQKKIKVCTHVILGLPGETHVDALAKARFLNRLPIDGVKVHNLVVFRNTLLERDYRKGDFKPLSLPDYVSQCVDFIENLNPDVLIQRLSGHGPKRFTIAPEWSINKWETINALHQEMEQRDSWQGKKLGAPKRVDFFKSNI